MVRLATTKETMMDAFMIVGMTLGIGAIAGQIWAVVAEWLETGFKLEDKPEDAQ